MHLGSGEINDIPDSRFIAPEGQAQVLGHGQLGEDLPTLRNVADAEAEHAVGQLAGDIALVEADAARIEQVLTNVPVNQAVNVTEPAK